MAVAETNGFRLVVAFTAIVPTMVVLGEWPYGVRPARRQVVGVVLGLVGIVMMTQGQGFGASLSGLLAVITSCATWTVGSVWAVHGLPGGAKLATASGSMPREPDAHRWRVIVDCLARHRREPGMASHTDGAGMLAVRCGRRIADRLHRLLDIA